MWSPRNDDDDDPEAPKEYTSLSFFQFVKPKKRQKLLGNTYQAWRPCLSLFEFVKPKKRWPTIQKLIRNTYQAWPCLSLFKFVSFDLIPTMAYADTRKRIRHSGSNTPSAMPFCWAAAFNDMNSIWTNPNPSCSSVCINRWSPCDDHLCECGWSEQVARYKIGHNAIWYRSHLLQW